MKQKYHSMDDVLVAVNEYVHSLNTEGGHFKFNVEKKFHPRKGGNILRLSSSGRCGRQMAYEALNPEDVDTPDVAALNIFMLGDVVHDFERYLIAQVTELHSVERTVRFNARKNENEPDLWVPGHMDGVVSFVDRDAVLDIKTASDTSFQRMLRDGPPEEYIYQLNAYMDAVGLEEAYLWVYNKNDSSRMVLPVQRSQAIVDKVEAHFASVDEAITNGQLPPRKYEPQKTKRKGKETGQEYLYFKCTWCPFVEECYGSLGFQPVEQNGKTRWLREANFRLEDII